MSDDERSSVGRIHSNMNNIRVPPVAPLVAPTKKKVGSKSGGARSEQPVESFESPLTMNKGIEKLKRKLRGYCVEERVVERMQLGVAAFMLISEKAMSEMLGDDIPAFHTGILIALRIAMQMEIDQHSGSRLFGGAGSGTSASAVAPVNLAEEQHLQGGGGAKGEDPLPPAPVDPYVYGRDNEGKNDVYALFGQVGGGVATIETRMPTSVKVGEIRKNFMSLMIARFNMELQTTVKDKPIQRADEWACVIALMGSERWKILGQSNWEIDVGLYMTKVMRGLLLSPDGREGFQKSCHFLNNIRYLEFTKDTNILEMFLYGKWEVGKLQIEAFESVRNGSGARNIGGDPKTRHMGLVATLKNFMWYIAAFAYEGYANVFTGLVDYIQASEHLFLRDGRLLVDLINKELGALMRAVSIKSSVEVDDIIYSLEGPHNVAIAMSACGRKLMQMFGEREAMRKKQEVFNEEVTEREAAMDMIESLSTGSKRRMESEGKEDIVESLSTSQRSKKRLLREQRVSNNKVELDLGFGRTGTNTQGDPSQGGPGQGKKNERSQSLGICNRNMAGLLKVKAANGKFEVCVRSATTCRFSHRALKDILQEEATRSVLAMGDTTDGFKERVIEKITASSRLFKQ
jgi:hypothetical protein